MFTIVHSLFISDALHARRNESIREGSFFFNAAANLTLIKILEIMYSYLLETATCRSLHREIGIESEAITNWQNFIRDDFAEYLLRHPVVIGGDGRTVEIDESAFLRKKHNIGREVRTQWVFGGTDTTTHEGFLVAVPQQSAVTLLPILQQYVRPGTTVVCDLWRAYNTISNLGYQHLTVKQCEHCRSSNPAMWNQCGLGTSKGTSMSVERIDRC